MIESSFTLLLSLMIVLFGYIILTKKKIKENFLPSMAFKVDRVAAPNTDFANKGKFWSVPGTFQPLVTPRSAPMQYGSQLQYNLPDESILAFKSDTPFANDGLLTSDSGEIVQPVTYDRFMFSNKKSRLREHGDPIRGDLPIIPHNSDWFRPSVQPHLDLKQGAMQVLGGFNNDTSNQLAQLMSTSSGNALQTFGGIQFSGADGLSQNMGEFMRSPTYESRNNLQNDSNNYSFISSAPQGSNLAQGFSATGMVPAFNLSSSQNLVTVDQSGDVNVMRG